MLNRFMEKWSNRELENGLLKFVVVLLAITIIVESGLMIYLYSSQRTVIIPAFVDKKFYVENNKASLEYIEIMSRYAIELISNFTPETVDDRTSEFIRFINPQYYSTVSTQLKAFASEMKRYNISQFFVPQSLVMKDNKIIIRGILRQFAQDKQISSVPSEYQLEYKINQGRFEILNYEKLEQKA